MADHEQASEMLHFALDYAKRGIPVFPCNPLNKAPFPKADVDDVTGKEIPNTGGLYKATVDTNQISKWWRQWPNAMIGTPTGRRSGFFAIDPDAPEKEGEPDGRVNWANLKAAHGGHAPTHVNNTPGGGQHILFRWREDRPVTNREGGLRRTGINVRGQGGYVIMPPSMAATSKRYEIDEPLDAFKFAEAPDWLYDLILRPEPSISQQAAATVRRPLHRSHDSPYVQAAVRNECDAVASATPGERNNVLNTAAFCLGTLVGAGELNEGEVIGVLLDAATASGLTADDGQRSVLNTINSGLRSGIKFPRKIPEAEREYQHPPRFDRAGAPINAEDDPQAASDARPTKITAAPYAWPDPSNIPRRDWLYGYLLVRKFVSATVSPGGVGKSFLVTTETLAMASGRDLLGVTVNKPLAVWLWNLEDPREEIDRRLSAAALHYDVDQDEVEGRLFINSGRDTPLVIAKQLRDGARIIQPVVDNLVAEIVANKVDVIVIDPFVSSHEAPENDNTAQDMIIKEWGRVADRGNCAVHLVDHTRKMGGLESEVTVESSRGAKSKTDGCRVVRAVNRMSKDEAKEAGVDNNRLYFRTFNDKANLSPPADKSDWFKLNSVHLPNGPMGSPGDSVAVVVNWQWPDAFADIQTSHLREAQRLVAAGEWKESVRSPEWVGIPIAEALGLDPDDGAAQAKIKKLLKLWIENKMFKVVRKANAQRKEQPYVEVDQCA